MLLVQQGRVYAPKDQGPMDILIGGTQILAMAQAIDPSSLPGDIRILDARGKCVVPGFIDIHQHFTGGGGEGGFHTRTPEMSLSMNIRAGVTTAVGLLGTDSLTRSVENLYAKTQGFKAEGLTAFMLTGAYWLPSPTLTGSVGKDVAFIEPVIGVKLAMADQRGPTYDTLALAKLASDLRVAALVANKPGRITVHTGINPDSLDLIFDAIDQYHIRPDIFIPTHVNRKGSRLSAQALELAGKGAFIDATAMEHAPGANETLMTAADFGADADSQGVFEQLTFSSDAGGSLPIWNEDRSRIIGMGIGTPASLNLELKRLVKDHGMDLSKALLPLTLTPAKAIGLEHTKGCIAEGAHADLVLLDKDSLDIRDVLAKGRVMMADNCLEKKGYFE